MNEGAVSSLCRVSTAAFEEGACLGIRWIDASGEPLLAWTGPAGVGGFGGLVSLHGTWLRRFRGRLLSGHRGAVHWRGACRDVN
jgi:hypothetical protein